MNEVSPKDVAVYLQTKLGRKSSKQGRAQVEQWIVRRHRTGQKASCVSQIRASVSWRFSPWIIPCGLGHNPDYCLALFPMASR